MEKINKDCKRKIEKCKLNISRSAGCDVAFSSKPGWHLQQGCHQTKSLSNGPCKKHSTTRQGMHQGCIIPDWLSQQNIPKLQVAVYLFLLS